MSTNFGAAMAIFCTRRKQYIYRIEDMTPLSLVLSWEVSSRQLAHDDGPFFDVLFYSAFIDEQKKMDRSMLNLESGLGNEIMSACWMIDNESLSWRG